MSIKLSVGLSRKIGEPHYCSRGASVGLEVESEVDIIGDPPRLEQHLAYLFRLAQKSLDQQLFARVAATTFATSNGHGPRCPATNCPATARQTRAIHAIANRLEFDLAAKLRDRFGVTRPDELTLSQASELIDAWKAPNNRSGGED